MGASNDSEVIENMVYRAFACYVLGTFGNEANIIYIVLFSPLSPFH